MPPDSLLQAIQSLWPLHRLTALISRGSQSGLAYPFAHLYLLLSLFGALVLFRRNWTIVCVMDMGSSMAHLSVPTAWVDVRLLVVKQKTFGHFEYFGL